MELVADESVDYGIIKELRRNGYEVYSIQDSHSGVADIEVLKIANKRNCLLITEDKDFGELTYRLKLTHKGILLIRIADAPRNERIALVVDMIIKYKKELYLKFSVLTARGLRIKKSTIL